MLHYTSLNTTIYPWMSKLEQDSLSRGAGTGGLDGPGEYRVTDGDGRVEDVDGRNSRTLLYHGLVARDDKEGEDH